MPGCLSCGRGLCDECHDDNTKCCVADLKPPTQPKATGAPWKPDEEIKDPRSTMRKRAQKILRDVRGITIGDPCEWRGLAECGGGRHPIVGCVDGLVKHIHHGPDKNWFNNSPDNLHAICHSCHNRWHARNDKCYDPGIPHRPRSATPAEMREWNDGPSMPHLSHNNCPPTTVEENKSTPMP